MTTNLIPLSAVAVCNGTVRTTSLEVAKAFDKEHRNVCRDIEQILSQVVDNSETLKIERFENSYKNNLGKNVKQRAYFLNKNAFMLLVMGFTGEKAMQIKIGFIKLFDLMESKLRELQSAPVQPELPMNCAPVAAGPFSALKYQGVEVIPTDELRRRLGVTVGSLENWLRRNRPLIEGVDVFRIQGVTDRLELGMIRAGFHVKPRAISVNLYTRSGFTKAAARFKPESVVPEVLPDIKAELPPPLDLPLPRLAPGVTAKNFTFKIQWYTVSAHAHFSDTAASRLSRKLLEMGYDPTELLRESYAAHVAAARYSSAIGSFKRRWEGVNEFARGFGATMDSLIRVRKQEEFFTFRADGSPLESVADFNSAGARA